MRCSVRRWSSRRLQSGQAARRLRAAADRGCQAALRVSDSDWAEEQLPLHLSTLKKSRRRLKAGDVFVMAPSDGKFLFGRVINTNSNPLGVGGAILIYI